MKLIIKISILLLIFSVPGFSFTEQATTERIIKENRSFIDFLNVCITNFGDQNKTNDFKNVYEMHFNGFVAYLQSDYKRAFNRIYDSQAEEVDLCSDLVKNFYLEDSKDILDKLAPIIVRAKSPKSRLYLTLGYRDRTVGRNNYVVGMASNPKLRSYKIYQFIKSVKRARRAKKYGFLALYESQSKEMKHKIFDHIIKKENDSGNPFYRRFIGKSGNEFIDEMNKKYGDHREQDYQGLSDNKGATQEKAGEILPDKDVYESQIQKRTRFRNEARLAKLLLFSQFDRADDFIKKYIDDFDFKKITATFEVLSAEKTDIDYNIDFNSFKVHHIDNYSRLYNVSAIDTFKDSLKVEDDISENSEAEAEFIEDTTKISGDRENVIDKKAITDKQEKIEKTVDKKGDDQVIKEQAEQ